MEALVGIPELLAAVGRLLGDDPVVDIGREHERWTSDEWENGHIRGWLRLLPPEEGGCRSAIASGYRSHWAFPPEIHGERHHAPLTFEPGPGEWLGPSEEAMVRLHPLSRDLWPRIVPGIHLTMLEGARVVGVAEVVEVVPAGP